MSYDMIDRFLRNNLDDDNYAEYSAALDELCTPPEQRKPLTDEQFLELMLKTGSTELVSWATFVGGSIQMQGKIGLLRGAKLLKAFLEAHYGITGEKK